jgi:hypothetical protein
MLILGQRERLEAALGKGAGPLRVMLGVPAPRVRESQPTHEFGEIAAALRPNYLISSPLHLPTFSLYQVKPEISGEHVRDVEPERFLAANDTHDAR